MKKHLKRLDQVYDSIPTYFITTCTDKRGKLLATKAVHELLLEEWSDARERHGWLVGSYVVMPDHVHFFARPSDPGTSKPLSKFIGTWKQWTSKRFRREVDPGFGALPEEAVLWQPGFFDHVLRSSESYSEKWDYVRNNPVRAGLVGDADDWPYSGVIHDLTL